MLNPTFCVVQFIPALRTYKVCKVGIVKLNLWQIENAVILITTGSAFSNEVFFISIRGWVFPSGGSFWTNPAQGSGRENSVLIWLDHHAYLNLVFFGPFLCSGCCIVPWVKKPNAVFRIIINRITKPLKKRTSLCPEVNRYGLAFSSEQLYTSQIIIKLRTKYANAESMLCKKEHTFF